MGKSKFASQEQVWNNEVLVVICYYSSSFGVRRLEPSVYYSFICFLRRGCGERDDKANAIIRCIPWSPTLCTGGSMSICSANFEKWAAPGWLTVKDYSVSVQ